MSEKEIHNVYAIPANYTDSGKLFGGLLETRNTVEAVLLIFLVGYPEVMWLHIPIIMKFVLMVVTLLPLGIIALMGIGGDTLFEFFAHMILHFFRRRKLHFRRIGRKNEILRKKTKKKNAPKTRRKANTRKRQTR
jgi:hypothetical protein